MPLQKPEKNHLRQYLLNLLATYSKHSAYQEIYPPLLRHLNAPLQSGKYEAARWDYMKNRTNWADSNVIDIGANTGYFSMAAIESHANEVVAVEGNDVHAKFIIAATELMEWQSRLYVENRYFEFEDVGRAYDIGICFNVLHHIGDDFGDPSLNVEEAKKGIEMRLQNLSKRVYQCWFQLGFNWKGDPNAPLFTRGLKSELIDFIQEACSGFWLIEELAIYDPAKGSYEPADKVLLQRFNDVGEFLNRPLFLLESKVFHDHD